MTPMTPSERTLWRLAIQAAFAAARAPQAVGAARDLKRALAGSEGWRLPDMRPLPLNAFLAFLMMARAWSAEPDMRVRQALAERMAAMADMAGDILDGLAVMVAESDQEAPAWTRRADLA